MKKGEKGEVKVALIVAICILVVALLIIFGVIAWQLFHTDKKEQATIRRRL